MKSEIPVIRDEQYPPLVDYFGRKITYLRQSVTDRCNFRCRYCMPEKGVPFVPHHNVLRLEEMERIIGVLSRAGVFKIRITGGEPMVRKGLVSFLERIAALNGVKQLHLTTNGSLLSRVLPKLEDIHLSGINLSLDSLKPDVFKHITRRDDFNSVNKALHHLLESSKIPLKINMVVLKGINDEEIRDFANLAMNYNVQVRFIEYMPFNGDKETFRESLSAEDIKLKLEQYFGTLLPQLEKRGVTAQLFEVRGFKGKIGIIGGYSRNFCASCNRLRISATGQVKNCLYGSEQNGLLNALRSGISDDGIYEFLRQAVLSKKVDGFASEKQLTKGNNESMASIGG